MVLHLTGHQWRPRSLSDLIDSLHCSHHTSHSKLVSLSVPLPARLPLFPTHAQAIGGALVWLLGSNRDLLSSPDLLARTLGRILSYHAAGGLYSVNDATSPVRVRTAEGSEVTLSSVK